MQKAGGRREREREREKPAIRENGICSCSFLPPSLFPPFLVRPPPRPFRQQGGRAGSTLYPFRLLLLLRLLLLRRRRCSPPSRQPKGQQCNSARRRRRRERRRRGREGGRGFANFLGTRNEKGGPSPPTSTALAKLGPSSSLSSSSSFPSQLANLFCAQIRNNAEPSPSPPLLPQSFVCLPPPSLPPLLCNFFSPLAQPASIQSLPEAARPRLAMTQLRGRARENHPISTTWPMSSSDSSSRRGPALPLLCLLRPQSRVARGLDCDLVKKRSVPELEKERAEDPPYQRTKILKSEDNISNSPPPLLLPQKVTSLFLFWP